MLGPNEMLAAMMNSSPSGGPPPGHPAYRTVPTPLSVLRKVGQKHDCKMRMWDMDLSTKTGNWILCIQLWKFLLTLRERAIFWFLHKGHPAAQANKSPPGGFAMGWNFTTFCDSLLSNLGPGHVFCIWTLSLWTTTNWFWFQDVYFRSEFSPNIKLCFFV